MYGSKLITGAVVALCITAAGGFGYAGYRLAKDKGDKEIAQLQAQYAQARQEAIEAALKIERANHERSAKATAQAVARTQAAGVDALAAADELRLLNAAALTYARDAESAAHTHQLRADLFHDLLGRCAAEYVSMAQKADRADNAARTLTEAWPK